ncbi:hypothetical protein EV401DRAFT_1924770 [Pisolithus croceorrhizus]|nr:hypothetical protein EV401DRAFT_1924770 [Pisolithus croceorrhizus]
MSVQVLSHPRLSPTSTYPKPISGDTTNAAIFKRRPRTPTFSSLIRVPTLSMPVLKKKPSMPFGFGKRRRSGLGTIKQATGVSNCTRSSDSTRRVSSSQIAWRSSESSSNLAISGYAPYVPLDPPIPSVPIPSVGTKILERFWPENEPFFVGDADVSQQPPEDVRSGSVERTQAFSFEVAMDDWTAGSGLGLEKEIPHRFSMLTPPPSRRVSRMQPVAQDLPFSDEFPTRPSVDHRMESELRFPF